jgi:hypothetical protein
MKSITSLCLAFLTITTISCKDDEESIPTFQQSDFIGEWEVTAYQAIDGSTEGPCGYTITIDEFNEVSGCGTGFEISIGGAYTFDGKNRITLDDQSFGELSWIILELSNSKLRLEQQIDGTKYGTVTASK